MNLYTFKKLKVGDRILIDFPMRKTPMECEVVEAVTTDSDWIKTFIVNSRNKEPLNVPRVAIICKIEK